MASLAIALPVGGGGPQNANGLPLVALRCRRCSSGCAFPPLGIGVQAMQLSPYHAGLAGRHRKRLRVTPASRACSFPLWLSPSGEPDGPETSLRVSPDCVRDSAPRSAAHTFTAHGSPRLIPPPRKLPAGSYPFDFGFRRLNFIKLQPNALRVDLPLASFALW